MHEYAMSIIQYVYKDDFESAEIEAKKNDTQISGSSGALFFRGDCS
jgi:hypothetical protein